MSLRIPTPEQCGLPRKFTHWRKVQPDALEFALESPHRFVGICAPTGSGKSALVVALANLSKKNTAIITASKGLQDQYIRDFEEIGMVDLRGRNNYSCDSRPGDPTYTCEQGYAAQCPYKGTVSCSCSQAEMRAASSSLVVMNYAKWCSGKAHGQGLEHYDQVIFDEGHAAFDALSSDLSVELGSHEIEEDLKIDFPKPTDALEFRNWKEWFRAVKLIAESEMIAAQARITGVRAKPSHVKQFVHMRNLTKRLATLCAAREGEWVVDEMKTGYMFNPVFPGKYSEGHLFFGIQKVYVVSATLRPKSLGMLGIKHTDFAFKEFDSDFDPKRSPIYFTPAMRVDARTVDKSMLWLRMDQILSRRQDRKGIIQTTSFDYQKDVRLYSQFASKMILNNRGEAPTGLIEQFKKSSPGTVMVSPSIGMGYDFPGDTCRYQIILKIPFEPPSAVLKAREEADREYRGYRAMQKLVQALGRDCRSQDDWSERFLLDSHWEWFKRAYGHLAPKSFHGFVKNADILPQPPKLGSL